jgi:hypothetical protein
MKIRLKIGIVSTIIGVHCSDYENFGTVNYSFRFSSSSSSFVNLHVPNGFSKEIKLERSILFSI